MKVLLNVIRTLPTNSIHYIAIPRLLSWLKVFPEANLSILDQCFASLYLRNQQSSASSSSLSSSLSSRPNQSIKQATANSSDSTDIQIRVVSIIDAMMKVQLKRPFSMSWLDDFIALWYDHFKAELASARLILLSGRARHLNAFMMALSPYVLFKSMVAAIRNSCTNDCRNKMRSAMVDWSAVDDDSYAQRNRDRRSPAEKSLKAAKAICIFMQIASITYAPCRVNFGLDFIDALGALPVVHVLMEKVVNRGPLIEDKLVVACLMD